MTVNPNKNSPESSKVKNYRKKLEESLIEEKKLFNPESLDKMKLSIHEWIDKHSLERINLKDKNIALFDENQHSASPKSKYILHLIADLKQDKAKLPKGRKFQAKKI
jgi:hypothetical protein